jgi:hypothetical protein
MPSFAHTAYISPTGDDGTAALDNPSLPFATAQAAFDIVQADWYSNQSDYYLLSFADGDETNYGAIGVFVDWPEQIWIEGAGRNTTSIGGISGSAGGDQYGTGGAGTSLNINSDGSIKVAYLQGGSGGTGIGEGYNCYGGAGGNVIAANLYISGNVTGGNGGGTNTSPYGDWTYGGNGGSVTLTNCYCTNAYGGTGAGTSSDYEAFSGIGGSVTISGVLSGETYASSIFYGGDSASSYGNFGGSAATGGGIDISDCTFNSCVAGSSSETRGFNGIGGASVSITNCTLINAATAASGGLASEVNYGTGSGGNITFTNSTCQGWLYAGNGAAANIYDGGNTAGNGGNITIVNSTIPDGLYGGIAGPNTYNADYYYSGFGSFGQVIVDGNASFSYPATQAVTYRNNLESTANWDVFVNWEDADGNYASIFPSSTTDINIYDSIGFASSTSLPISVKSVSVHDSAYVSIGFSAESITMRDSSMVKFGDSFRFSCDCPVDFYDDSGVDSGYILSGGVGPLARLHSNSAMYNVFYGAFSSEAAFGAYEYVCSSSGGGNSGQISRLLGLPWFINI